MSVPISPICLELCHPWNDLTPYYLLGQPKKQCLEPQSDRLPLRRGADRAIKHAIADGARTIDDITAPAAPAATAVAAPRRSKRLLHHMERSAHRAPRWRRQLVPQSLPLRRSLRRMTGDDRILEALNDVLTAELTAINQYFIDAKMCGNWGYERLAEKFRHESIDEMKDADELIERILLPRRRAEHAASAARCASATPSTKSSNWRSTLRRRRSIVSTPAIALGGRSRRQRHPRAVREDPRSARNPTPTGSKHSCRSSTSSASRCTCHSRSTSRTRTRTSC